MSDRDEQIERDLVDGGAAFMRAVQLLAVGNAQESIDVLKWHTGFDEATFMDRLGSLAMSSVAMTASLVRASSGYKPGEIGGWAIRTIPGLDIDKDEDPTSVAAARMLVEFLNYPNEKGALGSHAILASHLTLHGPNGVVGLIFEWLKVAVVICRDSPCPPWSTDHGSSN